MGIGENGHIAFNDPHVANFTDNKIIKMVDLPFTGISKKRELPRE